MNPIEHSFIIDLQNRYNRIRQYEIKQFDTDSHKFAFTLLDNSVAYNLTGLTGKIYIKKPNGDEVFSNLTINSAIGGKLSFLLTTQCLTIPGTVEAEITLYGTGGEVLTSITFTYIVKPVLRDDEAIESTNEYTALTEALAEVQNIDNRFAEVNSLLEEKTNQINSINLVKADKTYVDTKVSTIGNASPKGTYSTLTALQTAYPTGTSGIYVVTANGHWYYWSGSAWTDGGQYQSTGIANTSLANEKYIEGSYTRAMTKFYKVISTNLFDKNFVSIGYPSYSTGVWTNDANFRTSDYIPCVGGESYIAPTNSFVVFYDVNKNFVSGINSPSCTVPSGQGIAYLRYVLLTSAINTFRITKGTTLLPYQDFKVTDEQLIIKTENLAQNINVPVQHVDLEVVEGFSVNPQNLFNKAKVILGHYYNYQTNEYVTNASFCTSELIRILENTTYSHRYLSFQSYYDENGVFLGGSNTRTFTTPAGTKYIRLGMDITTYTTEVLVQSSTVPTSYAPFNYLVDTNLVNINIESRWKGKKWASLGDSITANNKYQPLVINKLGVENINYGVGSSTIAINSNSHVTNQSFVERAPNIDTSVNLISIFGAVNDFDVNTPMGTIASTDTSTFYGALKYLIEYFNTNIPDAQPVFFTPLPWYVKTTNALGLKLKDYRNAIIEVAELYGIPYLDLFTKSGFNSLNIARYTSDLIHPNDLGTEYYYPRIVGFFNSI
jgi:lysophospholipase L1-like esterase